MNPAFIILVILGAIALWFLLSSAFSAIGRIIYGFWKRAVDEINKEDEEEEKEE